jgi:hypothetical protein
VRAKEVMRLDTLILLCIDAAEVSPCSGEITDALGIIGIDMATSVVNGLLKRLGDEGLIQLTGYRQRYGHYKSRAFGLTSAGRHSLDLRREMLLILLEDPPQINDPDIVASVSI